jgi:RNA polymerase sigma-70 factor (ECF subfamily)
MRGYLVSGLGFLLSFLSQDTHLESLLGKNRFFAYEVPMCQTDEELVQRCLNGEPDAYRRLVQRHQNALLAYLVGRLGSHDLAEEVSQEAFVRAYFSLGKLRKGKSFLPWLLGIAVRAGQEQARSRKRVAAAGDLHDVPAPAKAQEVSREESLMRAVARLPAVYREVVLLRYHAGLSCAEMSENMGIPVGSVTKRLSRAYALLRESLARPEQVVQEEVKS